MVTTSAQVGQEIFLGGNYLDLGLNSSGTLGTVGNAPTGFATDASDGYLRLGMMADLDGFGTGKATTLNDVMLLGTPVETFSIGYDIGSKQYTNTNSARDGIVQITGGVSTNLSDSTAAKAGWVGTTAQGLQVNQVMSLTSDAKYVQVTITLTNTTSTDMTDLRYMRSIDPDQGPTFTTNNKIIAQGGDTSGGALVAAYATGTTDPFFFYSQDERADVSVYGFENRDPYAAALHDSPQAIGYTVNADDAVNIDFALGTLAAGQSTTITYYMGVTDDLTSTVAAINAAAAASTGSSTSTAPIAPVNHAPVAVADSLTIAANASGTGNVLSNDTDADNDTLHATLKTGPAHGTVTVADDGTYKYTPTAGYSGSDSFTYTVSDGQATSTGTVTLTVTPPPNHAPVAVADALTVAANSSGIGNVLTNDTDADNDTLHASLKTNASHGTVTVADDGTFKYTPTAGYSGSDSFTYTVSDGQATSTATVTLTVTPPPNHAPVAVADALTVTAGMSGTGNVLSNDTDADNDVLHATLQTNAAHGTVTVADDGTFKYTPTAGYTGSDSFTYTVSDGQATATGTVSLTVTPAPNHAPVAVADALTVVAGATGTGNVLTNDTDADNDTLHASLAGAASHGTVTVSDNGTFSYTPTAGYSGSDSFTYTVSDGKASATGTVTLTVTPPPNHAPVAVADALTIAAGAVGTGNVLANDTDADNDVLHATLTTNASHGVVTIADNGAYTYTPTAGYSGSDSFTYSASDGQASSTATVTITVQAPPPVVVAPPPADTPVTFTVHDGSASTNDTLVGTSGHDEFYFDLPSHSGADTITNFGHEDILVTSGKLFDGNNDGIIDFQNRLYIDAPKGKDTVTITGVSSLRLMGQDADGHYVYANNAQTPTGALESKIGDDVLKGDTGDKTAQTFFFDTNLGLNLGHDQITNFGAKDVIVTTTALQLDTAGLVDLTAGTVSLGNTSLGSVTVTNTSGAAVAQLEYDGTVTHDGLTYYLYAAVGSGTDHHITFP